MYKKKKKVDRKYIILLIGIIFILVLAFIISSSKSERDLNPVEKVIRDAGLKVGTILSKPFSIIQTKIKDNKDKDNIYKKYSEIIKEYEKLESNEAYIDELQKELTDLKKILKIQNTLSEYENINATVVNHNPDYWYDTFTIDKGEYHGITKDMAVVTSDGLIGKVINTSYLFSTVRMITSDELDQKISIKINISKDKYVYGLLSGYDKKNKCYLIEGIAENVEIPKDATVTTTGMSNIFPSGILVGKVKGTKKDNFDLTMLVEVIGNTDIDDITYVSVLKRKSEVE